MRGVYLTGGGQREQDGQNEWLKTAREVNTLRVKELRTADSEPPPAFFHPEGASPREQFSTARSGYTIFPCSITVGKYSPVNTSPGAT